MSPEEEKLYPLPNDPRAAFVRDWLSSKHVTLWGQPFELVKDGPGRAVQWFLDQIDSFDEFLKEDNSGFAWVGASTHWRDNG